MGAILGWIGGVLFLVGIVWLAYHAWTNQKPVWAICNFCLSPVAGGIYSAMNFDETKIPGGLMVVGFILGVAGRFIPS